MDNEESLTQEEWAVLFDAAIAFKELKCWEWMYDRDMFGVQSPETGEIGYCCVMGQLGEVLGLNVYLGPQGFASYRQLQELALQEASGDGLGPYALLNTQRCLMASFEDRTELHQQDLRLIKSLGLKFRGKKEWPMFQSYRPGYLPWFLTRSEGRFLTVALQQAIHVAEKIRVNPHMLDSSDNGEQKILVRMCENEKWSEEWEYPPAYETSAMVPVINELQLAQLKKANLPRRGLWAADCIMLPMPIRDGARPYYPYGFPVITSEGQLMGMELIHSEKIHSKLPQAFLNLLENRQCLPQSLRVRSEQAFVLLEPIARKLQIPFQRAQSIPELEFFLQSMDEYFGG
jgi:hypothetical protein